MNESYFIHRRIVIFETMHVKTIQTPPLIPEVCQTIQTIMQSHGGSIKLLDTQISQFAFPEGTVKEEIWPRTMTLRYKVRFPDGYTIFETYNPNTDRSNLRFPIEDFPSTIQKHYFHLINYQDTNSEVEQT